MRIVPSAADPIADLARLRRPAGPWLHLLDGAPADARQLGWMLGHDGVVVRILRGHSLRSRYGLFDETAAAAQLPGDPVEDWPALAALLTDMSWLPGTGHVLVATRAALLLAAAPLAELHEFVGAIREVAGGRAEEGEPLPFHVVLQDDEVGLAALRARLDAAGARYDALTGWDAQEPAAGFAVGGRAQYSSGQKYPDQVDRAVTLALSQLGVTEVRRAWEEYRGPANDPVRLYAPVLPRTAPLGGVELATVAAAAAAQEGAACLVLPLPADPARYDRRQAAVASVAAVVWPEPEPEPEPEPQLEPKLPLVDSNQEPVPEPAAEPPPDVPGDDPQARFELVAANLEWEFATGAPGPDPVEAALLERAIGARAGGGLRLAALFRTWVRDPASGWVRVVLAYVGPGGSIADIEAERNALVTALRAAGAGRCCLEIVAASERGDVQGWLEDRCVQLWRAPEPEPEPAPLAQPAAPGQATAPAEPAAPPSPAVPTDAAFSPGPVADDPAFADVADRLIDWAADRPQILGLVTAWTGPESGGGETLVLGVVVDGEAPADELQAEAAALLSGAGRAGPDPIVESLAPSLGLAPLQLRLYRGSTRLWTRRASLGESRPQTGTRPPQPAEAPATQPPTPAIDRRPDLELPNGFVMVGIGMGSGVEKGPEDLDARDTALVRWAQSQPNAVGLVRGTCPEPGVSEDDSGETPTFPMYALVFDAEADTEQARRDLAMAIFDTGVTKAAVEALTLARPLSVFHIDLVKRSRVIWKRAGDQSAPAS